MSRLLRIGLLGWLACGLLPAVGAWSQETEEPAKPQAPGKNCPTLHQIRTALEAIPPYLPKRAVETEIDVFGSTSMDSLAHGCVAGFQRFHPKATVVISAEGSETTFERLAKNPTSIGMVSRPVTEEDLKLLKDQGLKQPVAVMVAREALGIYVHENNPLEAISYAQLVTLLCPPEGVQPAWGDVGVTGALEKEPVVFLARGEKSGTHSFLTNYVFRGKPLRSGKVSESNAKLIATLEKTPGGIAISGLKCGAHGARILALRDKNTLIPSDDHSVLVGRYPLVRPLTLVLDMGREGSPTDAAREFVRYAVSQPGQLQAILSGFFPFDPPTLRAEMQKVDFEKQQPKERTAAREEAGNE